MSMNPSRYAQTQGDAERQREAEANVRAKGLTLDEALRVLAEVHTAASDQGFVIRHGVMPDFTRLPHAVYELAWATVRKHLGLPV